MSGPPLPFTHHVCFPSSLPSSTRLASSLGNLYEPDGEAKSSVKQPSPSSFTSSSHTLRTAYSGPHNYRYELNNNQYNTSSTSNSGPDSGRKSLTFNLNHTSPVGSSMLGRLGAEEQGAHRGSQTGLSGLSARYLSRSIPVSDATYLQPSRDAHIQQQLLGHSHLKICHGNHSNGQNSTVTGVNGDFVITKNLLNAEF